MSSLSSSILKTLASEGLSFPGLDEEAVLEQILPTAEEWIMTQILTKHLSTADQELFRDSYISAPDIFDPVEFLSDILPNLSDLVDNYSQVWIEEFKKTL